MLQSVSGASRPFLAVRLHTLKGSQRPKSLQSQVPGRAAGVDPHLRSYASQSCDRHLADQQRAGSQMAEGGESGVDLAPGAGPWDREL